MSMSMSKLALSAAQLKRKKIHTIHTSSQLQKKHYTGTEVMAKKSKSKTKLYKKGGVLHALSLQYVIIQYIHKIQCVIRNTIKYNTVNIYILIEPTPIGGRG